MYLDRTAFALRHAYMPSLSRYTEPTHYEGASTFHGPHTSYILQNFQDKPSLTGSTFLTMEGRTGIPAGRSLQQCFTWTQEVCAIGLQQQLYWSSPSVLKL